MPLYEGTTLILEKQAVVLDLGTKYTKFGFTGESSPRCIVRSQFPCEKTRCLKDLFNYKTPQELQDNLVQMLHLLYFRHVLVNPKDRKVVVVEDLLSPTLFRETLARVLYLHYEVSSVVWAPSAVLCAVSLGGPSAVLVVSLGWAETTVVAVVHGVPVLHAVAAAPLAGRAIQDNLLALLREDNGSSLELSHDVLEDIKVKTCFVTSLSRAAAYGDPTCPSPPPAPSVSYPAGEAAPLLVSGRTRELAAECLFATDNECSSLAETILDVISKCPVDARRPLAAHVLVTGGTALLPGLRARLSQELRHHVARPRYSPLLFIDDFLFHTAPAKENYCAWMGGALLGATDALNTRALSRETYLRERRVKDWVNLLDNTPPSHPHWSAISL